MFQITHLTLDNVFIATVHIHISCIYSTKIWGSYIPAAEKHTFTACTIDYFNPSSSFSSVGPLNITAIWNKRSVNHFILFTDIHIHVPDPDEVKFLEANPQSLFCAPEQEIDLLLSMSTHVLEPLFGSVVHEKSYFSTSTLKLTLKVCTKEWVQWIYSMALQILVEESVCVQ